MKNWSGSSKVLLQTVSRATGCPKNKMAATQTGSTHISACRQLRNKIPGSKFRFSISGNPLVLLPTVSDMSGSRYSRWRPPKPEVHILVAILDFQILVSPWSRDTVTMSPYFIKLVILIGVSFRCVTKR